MTEPKPKQRLAILRFNPEFALFLSKFNGQMNIENPIPADAVIVRTDFDFPRNQFAMVLRSASFDEVEDGAEIPLVKAPTFSAVREELVAADMSSK